MSDRGELLEQAIALVSDAIVVTRGGLVEDVNPAFEALSGRTRAACIGQSVDALRTLEPSVVLHVDGRAVPVHLERRTVGERTLEVCRDLTQGLALAQMTVLREQARTTEELASDFFYSVDIAPDGSITHHWISDSYTRITGWTVEDARVARGGYDFVYAEDRPILRDLRERIRAGETGIADYRIRMKSGELRWFRDFSMPLRDASGRVAGVRGAARDVHDERLAEIRLRLSEERHRLLAENSHDIISILAPDGACAYVSPSVTRVLGYLPEELVGQRRFGLGEFTNASAQRGGGTGTPPTLLVTRVPHKDGHYVHLETTSQQIRDEKGKTVAIQCSSRDVSERVAAEEALARSEKSLRDLLRKYPDPVAVQHTGVLVFVNPALVSLLGHDGEASFIARPVLDFIHPSDRDYLAERMATSGPNPTREFRMLTRDGGSLVVQATAIPILFEGQLCRVAFLHDRREEKRIEAELALSERLASLGRLASAVGHEVNNPLTYVLGGLELLDRELEALGQEGLRARVAIAREGANRVRDIVHDRRSLSAAEEAPEARGCDLRRVLELAAATAAHEIRHRARLVIEHGEGTDVAGAEGRLVQVFVNLLVNAAQSIPDGNVEGNEIKVVSRRVDNNVVVEVHDTGSGITDAERIFEPFFTTKPAGVGTGLGLSIVQRILSSLGGSITASPRSPRGSTFRVTLVARSAARTLGTQDGAAAASVKSARVLVVDDEPLIGRIASMLLEPHEVVTVDSGRRAIELLGKGEHFDAILCDLQMKELGGADVYEWVVREHPELVPRLAFMSGGAFTDRARSFQSRRPCLDKPFDAHQLREMVERLLAAR